VGPHVTRVTEITSRLTAALADRYTIERRLGEGGMATVYLAADLKHDRQVAIKVLKPELAAVLGAERFVQEIKTTASLQHPNILPLFDSGTVEQQDGAMAFLFYVMPYIEGETLREKLDRETQLGIDEAVKIATEVAEALDYAHRNGVIHRDIKPENILLHDGRPMVADFGIALAVSAAAGGRMTETGLSLGTPHYMSPEQATAEKDLTHRSDVYSLGTVLYEMLTGEPPHMGNSAQQIIMKIVTDTPRPVTELRKSVPPNVTAAVAKSLEKLAADRFESAKAFADALTNPTFTLPTTHALAVAGAPIRAPWKALSIATTVLAAVLAAMLLWTVLQPAPVMPVSSYSIRIPDGAFDAPAGSGLALSPDGTTFVYPVIRDILTPVLFVQRRGQFRGAPLPGTDGGFRPAISPDGSHVAFIALGEPGAVIKRVSLEGGQAVTIADSGIGSDGLAWGHDGFLYFDGLTAAGTTGIMRVSDAGGVPELVTSVDTARGETDHIWPEALPNGKGVLFTIVRSNDPAESDVAVLNLATREYAVLTRGLAPRFVAPRYVVFHTPDGLLMAAPFDPDRLEMAGAPATITEGVEVAPSLPNAFGSTLSVSASGKLMYMAAGGTTQYEMVWIDRDGDTEDLGLVDDYSPVPFGSMALSPDGTQLAFTKDEQNDIHLWIQQLPRGAVRKLTFEGSSNVAPRWTPDGRDVLFVSNRGGDADLYTKRADGSETARLLRDAEQPIIDGVLSGDGEWLVYTEATGNISAVHLGRDSVPVALLATPAFEVTPQLSPDGRWLTYMAGELNVFRVYVVPFPNVADTRYLISTDGGGVPLWAHNGRELFYKRRDDLVAVEVQPGPPFVVGEPRTLFQLPLTVTTYGVGPNDQRFLVIQPEAADGDRELIVVENWVEELKAKVGGNK